MSLASWRRRSRQDVTSRARFYSTVATIINLLSMSPPIGAAADADPPAIDTRTIFYASFDESARPEVPSELEWLEGSIEPGLPGKTGAAIRAAPRTRLWIRQALRDPDARGLHVDCWLRTRWNAASQGVKTVLELDFGSGRMLKLNRDGNGRLGFVVVSHAKDGSVRSQSVRAAAGTAASADWHRISFSWRAHSAALEIDGETVATRDELPDPFDASADLLIQGSDFDLDELRVSAIGSRALEPRSSANRTASPSPRAPRPEAPPFVEPPELRHLPATRPSTHPELRWKTKALLEEFDPTSGWSTDGLERLSISTTPGTMGTSAVLVRSGFDSPSLDLTATLSAESTRAEGSLDLEILRVVRTLERTRWDGPPNESSGVARFVTPWTRRPIANDEFHEIWLRVHAAPDAIPGLYDGVLLVRAAGPERPVEASIPFSVEVQPFSLDTDGPKKLGIYYYLEDKLFDPPAIRRELADLRAHGIRHLITDLELQHAPADQDFRVHVEMAKRGLGLIREAGFTDVVVVQNGLERVENWRRAQTDTDPGADPVLARVTRQTMAELDELCGQFPELDLYQVHLDEVLSKPGLLERFIALASLVRASSSVPIYITLNTRFEKLEASRRRLDPFVDLRGYHGMSFEWWLTRGHSSDEMERELKQSGDRAFFYHNARGIHFSASRSRLVNGLLLWAGPFESHAPWIYQRYGGSPFDDRDDLRHDFGMAFPADGNRLVSTRLWEATYEGWLDLQYLQTLERLVAETKRPKSPAVREAREMLDETRRLVRRASLRPLLADSVKSLNPEGGVWLERTPRAGSSEESPLLSGLERHLGPTGMDEIRRRVASHIAAMLSDQRERSQPVGAH